LAHFGDGVFHAFEFKIFKLIFHCNQIQIFFGDALLVADVFLEIIEIVFVV
jgi:hypothetical protein